MDCTTQALQGKKAPEDAGMLGKSKCSHLCPLNQNTGINQTIFDGT